MTKAIILLSGGLDSALALAIAKEKGRECHALSFNYGQKHTIELEYAKKIADFYHVSHFVVKIDPASFSNSALISNHEDVHRSRTTDQIKNLGIPNTYVPARNTLFLAYATVRAEIVDAQEIYVGFNVLDSQPYPDCRKEYVDAFQAVLKLATKQATNGRGPSIMAPLIDWDKKEIVRQARKLGVPIEMTWSCYSPAGKDPCGTCDACILRQQGLENT